MIQTLKKIEWRKKLLNMLVYKQYLISYIELYNFILTSTIIYLAKRGDDKPMTSNFIKLWMDCQLYLPLKSFSEPKKCILDKIKKSLDHFGRCIYIVYNVSSSYHSLFSMMWWLTCVLMLCTCDFYSYFPINKKKENDFNL